MTKMHTQLRPGITRATGTLPVTKEASPWLACYHLPGLFEAYEFYKVFLPFYESHKEYFYDWCCIGSIYGAPEDCLWGGGRTSFGQADLEEVFELMQEYGISPRLTFSNSLLEEKHLSDKKCNALCAQIPSNGGIIIYSDLLLNYIKKTYPNLYFVASTTKVITDFDIFAAELQRSDYRFVVPDFRLNKSFDELKKLSNDEKRKVEFLCNECCDINCGSRKECYESVSSKNLGEKVTEHYCAMDKDGRGYSFAKAMENPGFISVNDIRDVYMSMGFSNFKIEGRGLGSALLLEFIIYYMVKPEYQIHVREGIYLDNMLDLF